MILILTDTHLKDSSITVNRCLFAEVAKRSLGCDYILHLGDVFTNRLGQRLSVLQTFYDILDMLPVPMIVIPGNHDKIDTASADSYLDVYRYHPKLIVHREFGKIQQIKDLDVWGLPYFSCNVDTKANGGLLMAHAGIQGYYTQDLDETINAEALSGFKKIYSGHYHDYKEWNNITYIGSPYQVNGFGEDRNKGFFMLHNNGTMERIPFTDYEAYQTHEIDLRETSEIPAFDAENKRIRVTGTKEQIKNFVCPDGVRLVPNILYEDALGKGGESFSDDDIRDLFNDKFRGDKVLGLKYLENGFKRVY